MRRGRTAKRVTTLVLGHRIVHDESLKSDVDLRGMGKENYGGRRKEREDPIYSQANLVGQESGTVWWKTGGFRTGIN